MAKKKHDKKQYYSLRMIGHSPYYSDGDLLKTSDKVLYIGETVDCDVRYPQDNESLKESSRYYAAIIRNDDGDSWRIVRRSDSIDITIDGYGELGYVYELRDGDLIRFGNQEMCLRFRVHHDSHYIQSGTIIEKHPRHLSLLYGFLAVLTIVICGVIAWMYVERKNAGVTYNDVKSLQESVLLLKVDSVQWVSSKDGGDSLVAPTKAFNGDNPVGTAFLTTDGKLVTARHCIEYWLAQHVDLDIDVTALKDDDIIKWAIMTESQEQAELQLRVYCSVYAKDQTTTPVFTFCSTDDSVHINRTHDALLDIGIFDEYSYSWRTIQSYYENREMELGDIAYVDVNKNGGIALLPKEHFKDLVQSRDVAFLGYPVSERSDREITFVQGKLSRAVEMDETILVEGNINHGFSGSPVLFKTAEGICAIGVVSRVDSVSNGIFKWAVPVTEIEKMGGLTR